MSYEIIRKPFMLLETAGMLFKYVNQISLQSSLNKEKLANRQQRSRELNHRAGWLEEILYKVCKGLNPQEPILQRYFKKLELELVDACLAYFLLYSFTGAQSGYWQAVEEVKNTWRKMQKAGLRINPGSTNGLTFTNDDPTIPADLFQQVRALKLPAEFRLDLYGALSNMDEEIQTLAAFMEPYAQKLERCYEENPWLLEETANHWQQEFQKLPPLEFLKNSVGKEALDGTAAHTVVVLQLMNNSMLTVRRPSGEPDLDYNIFYIGSCLTADSVGIRKRRDQKNICNTLKYLGDWKRIEVLRRLVGEQGYGGDLAESMGMDTSNMYRMLTQLHQMGLLKQEQGPWRNYYRTDREAFREFLRQVEELVLGEAL